MDIRNHTRMSLKIKVLFCYRFAFAADNDTLIWGLDYTIYSYLIIELVHDILVV